MLMGIKSILLNLFSLTIDKSDKSIKYPQLVTVFMWKFKINRRPYLASKLYKQLAEQGYQQPYTFLPMVTKH